MKHELNRNRSAFLSMIAWSEGTSTIKESDDGYNVIVGGTLFETYSDHPRKLIVLNKAGLKSTAAGRYQLLSKYFDYYKKLLGLRDFSPDSQDQIALQQIHERNALDDVDNGNIESAIEKCSNIWASLPGNNYGQRTNTIASLEQQFEKSGGKLA